MQAFSSGRRTRVRHRLTEAGPVGGGTCYLDEGYGERPSEMMVLKVDPRIDSLRSDPELEAIIEEVCDKVERMRATLETDKLTTNGVN